MNTPCAAASSSAKFRRSCLWVGLLSSLAALAGCVDAGAPYPAVASAHPITIDASTPPAAPTPLQVPIDGKSPNGHEFGANSRYLTLDGKPWFPIMGEFHYSRYPDNEWEAEILKMKADGITVVSTYVFWIFHEETEGKFDWSGQRDLRKFVQLCAKHGMYVWVRIGPWDHGEVRNGGLPDWLLTRVPQGRRTNDETYLSYVNRFYQQIGEQIKGLYWKDGGMIIGTQIENEFKGAAAHMLRLLELARAAGIDTPYYTATGWDRATVPASNFLPVFGGYTEQFWSNSLRELPPNVNFFFTPLRAEDNVADNLQANPRFPGYNERYLGVPSLTAEMGGGMAIAYHRRPIMYGDDSTSAALVKLGAGISLLGYYMYHGGTNPDGLTWMQEFQSQPDGAGFNDMEVKSYDFQAPIGEFGQLHPAYRSMKILHQFIDDFGSGLATMITYYPAQMPQSVRDVSTPRVTARSDGKSGYIFINNYQRNYPLDVHKDFQISLKLPQGEVTIPRQPTTIPTGAYTIWPVNMALGNFTLEYSTAQLVCKIPEADTYVFFAWPGINPEFAFKTTPGNYVETTYGSISREGEHTYITNLIAGSGVTIRLKDRFGSNIQILVLSRDDALNLWKANLAGQERLLLSPAGLYFDGNQIHFSSYNAGGMQVGAYPAFGGPGPGFRAAGKEGLFTYYAMPIAPADAKVTLTEVKEAAPSVAAALSRRNVAMEPQDADFDRAALWSLKFPPNLLADSNRRPLLRIGYEGDVARIYAGNRFVNDNFYKGTPWEVGMWRLTQQEIDNGLDLKILPLRQDTPLFLEQSARLTFPASGEVVRVNDVQLLWEYQAVMTARQ